MPNNLKSPPKGYINWPVDGNTKNFDPSNWILLPKNFARHLDTYQKESGRIWTRGEISAALVESSNRRYILKSEIKNLREYINPLLEKLKSLEREYSSISIPRPVQSKMKTKKPVSAYVVKKKVKARRLNVQELQISTGTTIAVNIPISPPKPNK